MTMTTVWSIIAYGVIPLGAVCLLLLLSDVRSFQKIAMGLCSITIALGSLKMTLSLIFALFATIVFIFQTFTVFHSIAVPSSPAAMTVEMADRLRMREWRNDRNWWIALLACACWLVVWRLQIWTKRYCLKEIPPIATPVKKKQ